MITQEIDFFSILSSEKTTPEILKISLKTGYLYKEIWGDLKSCVRNSVSKINTKRNTLNKLNSYGGGKKTNVWEKEMNENLRSKNS